MRGVPITTDQLIRERKRCSYARVFVHVDASKPLVRSFRVHTPDGGSFIQRVVYEYEPRYCEVRKSLTHSTYLCQHSGKLKPKEAGIHRATKQQRPEPKTTLNDILRKKATTPPQKRTDQVNKKPSTTPPGTSNMPLLKLPNEMFMGEQSFALEKRKGTVSTSLEIIPSKIAMVDYDSMSDSLAESE